MRVAAPIALAAALLFAAPGVASADVIFDPADADELAAVLTEATADQDVCYGWNVQVDNAGISEESIGSNLGAGVPMDSSCDKQVELNVYITWTSESSESEDSASYDVASTPPGVTRTDLDSLDLDWDGLTGDDPDIVIGKAVTALPLLAADKGIAEPVEAAPETGTAPADAQLTDDPGSDFWRGNGGVLLWGIGLMLAGGVFAWWVLKVNRTRQRRARPEPEPEPMPLYIPDTVPAEFYQPPTDPDLAPAEKAEPKPAAEPKPQEVPEAQAEPVPAAEPEPQEAPEAPEAQVEPAPQEAAGAQAEPEPAVEPEPQEASEPQAEPESAAEPEPQEEPQAKPEPEESTMESPEAPGPEPERPAPSDQKDKE